MELAEQISKINLNSSEECVSRIPINIIIVQDTSGSMSDNLKSVITGMNEIVEEQKSNYKNARDKDGKISADDLCLLTWITFSGEHTVKTVVKDIPIQTMRKLTDKDAVADGMTALRDAMKYAFTLDYKYKDRKTMFFVITDGEDNSSTVSSKEIKEYIDKFNTDAEKNVDCAWSVVFIGSNQDAILKASEFGISQDYAMTYNDNRTRTTIRSLNRIINRVASGTTSTPTISQEERDMASQ